MKKTIVLTAALLISSVAIFAQDTKSKKAESPMIHKTYTCTMHPEVTSDKPGKCPKCGMALVEKKMGRHAVDSSMHKMRMHKKDSTMHPIKTSS
jgi:hypothetical protein